MKKKKDENLLIKAYKYPLILSAGQEKMIRSWMEQEKYIYNFFIQKRQYLLSLKRSNSEEYEKEYKKGFAKTARGKQDVFAWKTYWSCVYKELVKSEEVLRESTKAEYDYWRFSSLGDPSISLPTTCVEHACGTIENIFLAYKKMWESQKDKKRKSKKRKGKTNLFHPEQKFLVDDTSIPCGIKENDCSIAIQGNCTARVTGFSKIAKGNYKGTKVPKSLKIHYPKQHRVPDDARVTQLRIIKDGESFFLNVTFETQNRAVGVLVNNRPVVGMDLGTDNKKSKNFISMSDGSFESYRNYESCRLMDSLEKKKRKMQKGLRNKKGGNKNKRERQSKNYKKAYAKIAKIDARIAATRKYHSKMIASNMAERFSAIYMENLSIGNMTASAKGTNESPGKNVRAKSGLNRAMLNVAAYDFKQNLIKKAKEFGTEIFHVNPRLTSQRCQECGFTSPKNRKGTRFKCQKCHYETHADTNAAKNIKELGESGLNSIKELPPKIKTIL